MADLRIFSYLPNPRIYKATVAAGYCDVDIELRSGSSRPSEPTRRLAVDFVSVPTMADRRMEHLECGIWILV